MRLPLTVVLLALSAQSALAEEKPPPRVAWTPGPTQVEMGSLAKEKLPDGFLFADAGDTRKLMEHMGNRTDGSELGIVVPRAEGQNWFIVFKKRDVGFIKDDEQNSIDADALLKSITEATEEANKEREKDGVAPLHVKSWKVPPHYDAKTHHLVWALLADNGTHEIVNYNIRMLGREGFVSATFVDSAANFDSAAPRLKEALDGFTFKTGHSYAEWRPGDKVAEYGLTALVAAGAGAAAMKLGLFSVLAKFLAKGWKAIIVGLGAVGSWIVRLFRKKESKPDLQP
jgi:uncharacterized membrane-anchored protein